MKTALFFLIMLVCLAGCSKAKVEPIVVQEEQNAPQKNNQKQPVVVVQEPKANKNDPIPVATLLARHEKAIAKLELTTKVLAKMPIYNYRKSREIAGFLSQVKEALALHQTLFINLVGEDRRVRTEDNPWYSKLHRRLEVIKNGNNDKTGLKETEAEVQKWLWSIQRVEEAEQAMEEVRYELAALRQRLYELEAALAKKDFELVQEQAKGAHADANKIVEKLKTFYDKLSEQDKATANVWVEGFIKVQKESQKLFDKAEAGIKELHKSDQEAIERFSRIPLEQPETQAEIPVEQVPLPKKNGSSEPEQDKTDKPADDLGQLPIPKKEAKEPETQPMLATLFLLFCIIGGVNLKTLLM